MMVLDVKGMKSGESSNDPAEKYRATEGTPSRTPQKVAMFLAGVAAYLVSLFTSRAEAEPETAMHEDPLQTLTPDTLPPAMPDAPVSGPFWSLSEEWGSRLISSGGFTEDAPRTVTLFTTFDTKAGPPYALTLPEVPSLVAANDARVVLPVLSGLDPIGGAAPPAQPDTPAPDAVPDAVQDTVSGVEPDAEPEAKPDGPEDDKNCGCTGKNHETDTRNRAPQNGAPVQLYDISACAVLLISLTDLLVETTDLDGDALVVHDLVASSGSISVSEDGWVFDPGPQDPRSVTLTYQISDGEFSIPQTAHFSVTAGAVIYGTAGDDLLVGTMCSDEIHGGDGDDNIVGRGGDDLILGGAGNDHIVAGDGNDTIFGGDGDDIILAGAGDDVVWGGDGDDRLYGEAGNDTLFGEAGDDFLDGGDGDDLLLGGDGDDVILDGAGRDIVRGGRGNDRVIAAADGDDDIYDGGPGHDILDYSGASGGVTIDLVGGVATGIELGVDTISGFEEVIGGSGDTHFIAGGAPVILHGNGGNNTFEFVADDVAQTVPAAGHEISDFRCGDTIRLAEVDLFKKRSDDLEEMFEQIYGDFDDDQMIIRVRHDEFEDVRKTVIEADLDGDRHFETVIYVHGLHAFVITEYAA